MSGKDESSVSCIKHKDTKMVESGYDDEQEMTEYECPKCGQKALIEIQWMFTITL